jgi:hypothetical protein
MGDGKIQILTVLIPFIMSMANLNVVYRNFYLMLSEDIVELLSPCMNDDQINLLHKKLIETVAIKEGLFPVSECTISTHMLMDLARYIKLVGNVKGWWAFAGERAFSTIKRYLPRGGAKLEKTCFNRYCKNEEIVTDNCYKFNIVDSINMFSRDEDIYLKNNYKRQDQFQHFYVLNNNNNNNNINNNNYTNSQHDQNYDLEYTDFGFLLQKKINKFGNMTVVNFKNPDIEFTYKDESIFSMYEIDLLLKDLIGEIKILCQGSIDRMLEESSLYRIFDSYEKHQRSQQNKHKTSSFYLWIENCKNNILNYTDIVATMMNEDDMQVTCAEILNLKISLMHSSYQTAVIYGKKFTSRGINFKETNEYRDRDCYKNNRNKLKDYWRGDARSAWFKCRKESLEYYGQFNFFFTIPILNDRIVSNLLYGSAFFRRFNSKDNLDYINANDDSTPFQFKPKLRFIHLIHVFSTVFLVSAEAKAEDINSEPQPLGKNNKGELNKLYLIPLFPSRMKIQISLEHHSIFFDNTLKKKYFRYEI